MGSRSMIFHKNYLSSNFLYNKLHDIFIYKVTDVEKLNQKKKNNLMLDGQKTSVSHKKVFLKKNKYGLVTA